ncbi:unnamed protein product [Somion occarium]|uniref:Uncharacterized protein n=1 Tax=Somion occarium TaxID=3059160 RepID=A0ABP1CX04_9APHY
MSSNTSGPSALQAYRTDDSISSSGSSVSDLSALGRNSTITQGSFSKSRSPAIRQRQDPIIASMLAGEGRRVNPNFTDDNVPAAGPSRAPLTPASSQSTVTADDDDDEVGTQASADEVATQASADEATTQFSADEAATQAAIDEATTQPSNDDSDDNDDRRVVPSVRGRVVLSRSSSLHRLRNWVGTSLALATVFRARKSEVNAIKLGAAREGYHADAIKYPLFKDELQSLRTTYGNSVAKRQGSWVVVVGRDRKTVRHLKKLHEEALIDDDDEPEEGLASVLEEAEDLQNLEDAINADLAEEMDYPATLPIRRGFFFSYDVLVLAVLIILAVWYFAFI